MSRYIVSIALIFQLGNCFAQNLVLNSSFEQIDSCQVVVANQYQNIYHCEDWFHTSGTWTVDFFHPCMPSPYLDPPTLASDMYSYAVNGDGFLGFVFYGIGVNTREVVSSQLSSPLIKDSIYCFSMWFKNSKWYNCDYGIDNIGVCFTIDTITYTEVRNIEPVIRTDPDVFQTSTDWTELKGWFRASGGENFINIGSFGSDSETNGFFNGTNPASATSAYYFVDFVNLEHCSTGLINMIDIPNVVTPNGDSRNDQLIINHGKFSTLIVSIYNRWGDKVTELDGLTMSWDGKSKTGSDCVEGTYYVVVEGKSILGESVSKTQFIHLFR